MLLALAWRNIWRQRTRTLISLASIALASMLLVFMLSLQLGSYATMKENTLRLTDGFAQLQPPGYAEDPDIATLIPDAEALLAPLEAVPGIGTALPRASTFVILANGETSYGAGLQGIRPEREARFSTLAEWVREGRALRAGDDDAIVLGRTLARNLGVGIGDRVTLLGSGADRSVAADSLRVVGLLETGMPQLDRLIARMPLGRFRATFAMPPDSANVIALGGARLEDVNRALDDLRRIARTHGLVLRDWKALQPALHQAILLDFSTAMMIYVSLIVVVVFILINTIYMSVLERLREFSMMLAIGMRPEALARMMWLEILMLAGFGALLGIALGSALVLWFQFHGIPLPEDMNEIMSRFGLPTRIYPRLSPASALAAPSIIVLAVALGGLAPYLRLRRLSPMSGREVAG